MISDPLYKAITRPPMMRIVPGVEQLATTLTSFMITLFLSMMVFAIGQSLWYLLSFPAMYSLCIAVERKEPRAFRLIGLWLRTRFGSPLSSQIYWKGSTRDPLPFARGKRRRRLYLN